MQKANHTAKRTLRTIAVFEAAKGITALAALAGVLDLMHHDARHLAIELIGHFGLNPDAHYPSILLHYAELLPHADMRSLVTLGAAYGLARLLESYGLWNDRSWAEWLGALSGSVYIPFEIIHFLHRQSLITAVVFAANVLVVSILANRLKRKRESCMPRDCPAKRHM